MASLYALDNRPVNQIYSVKHIGFHFQAVPVSSNRKWTYLLSDNIRFNNDIAFAIQLKKPQVNQLVPWLEKIIVSGQCSLLFVEELDLSEVELKRIKTLCNDCGVTLINLFTRFPANSNVIQGPWH